MGLGSRLFWCSYFCTAKKEKPFSSLCFPPSGHRPDTLAARRKNGKAPKIFSEPPSFCATQGNSVLTPLPLPPSHFSTKNMTSGSPRARPKCQRPAARNSSASTLPHFPAFLPHLSPRKTTKKTLRTGGNQYPLRTERNGFAYFVRASSRHFGGSDTPRRASDDKAVWFF